MTTTNTVTLPELINDAADVILAERTLREFSKGDIGVVNGCFAFLRQMEARVVNVRGDHDGTLHGSGQTGWGRVAELELPGPGEGQAARQLVQAIREAVEHGDPAQIDPRDLHNARNNLLRMLNGRVDL